MKKHRKRVGGAALPVALFIITASIYDLPGNVTFAAPHQGRLQALVSRIALNPRPAARLITRVLHRFSIQPVYAQTTCSTKTCNGSCFEWPAGTCACRDLKCNFTGADQYCESLAQRTCYVTGYGQVQCLNANGSGCTR